MNMLIRNIIPLSALGVLAACGGGSGGGGTLPPDSVDNLIMMQSAFFRERGSALAVPESDFPASGSMAYAGYTEMGIGESASNQISYAGQIEVTASFDGAGDVSGRIFNIHSGGFVATAGRTGYVGPVNGELIISNGEVRYGQPNPALYPDLVADIDGTLRHPDTTGRRPELVRVVEGTFQANLYGEDMQYLHGSFMTRDPQPFEAAFGGSFEAQLQD